MKVTFAGDTKVGKTSIIHRYESGEFRSNTQSTIGASFINISRINSSKNTITMQIWDTAGQERFQGLLSNTFRFANVVVLVYDITNHESLDNLKNFLPIIGGLESDAKIFVVGNKSDLENERKVTTEEGRSFSTEINASYFCEVSAKNDININELFTRISNEYPSKIIDIPNPSSSPQTSLIQPKKTSQSECCKVAFVGDTKTGKSCILSRFVEGTFNRNKPSTVGAFFLNTAIHNFNKDIVTFQIWDTGGLEKYRPLAPMYYRSAEIIVLTYDITNRQTFDNLENWVAEVKDKAPLNTKIVIVGNKIDLENERQVTTEEGQSFSTEINASYFCEVSAKNDININELFTRISDIYLSEGIDIPNPSSSSQTSSIQSQTSSIQSQTSSIQPQTSSIQSQTSSIQSKSYSIRSLKVTLIGDTKAGKSCIVSRFVQGTFDRNMPCTIGAAFLTKIIKNSNGNNVRLQLWDTAGLEKFRSLAPKYYRSASIIVLTYDITNRRTFDNLENWVAEVKDKAPLNAKIVIVGNKSDLENERQVTTEEGQSYSTEINASYFCEVSAKTNINIDQFFQKIADICSLDDNDNNSVTTENKTNSNESNNSFKFSLNSNNFKGIPFHLYEKNFTFIVNGKRYETNRIVADILSPLLRKSHYSDNSINEFSFDTSNQFEDDYFNDFLNLASLEEFEIDSKRQKIFSEYFYCLGNIDCFLQIQPNYFNQLTVENSIQSLLNFIKLIEKCPAYLNYLIMPLNKIITFIATHFEEIDKNQLNGVNVDIIKMIINNESLRLKNEDSLLKFAIKMYEQNHQYYELFEYVSFLNVKEKTFKQFIKTFQSNDINQIIWKSITSRILVTDKNPDNDYKEFNGLINYLTKGNYNLNKTIKITSDSSDLNNMPSNLIDYKNENCFKFDNFINFDFIDNPINISGYSLQSDSSGGFLKDWVIEASNDDEIWIEIDRHSNENKLNGPNKIGFFDIHEKNNEYYRFVRLRQSENSWSNHKSFGLKRFEFFGKIKQK